MNYVIVLPDKSEYFYEANPNNPMFTFKDLAYKAVCEAGLTTSRDNLESVFVNILSLHIKDGKLIRKVERNNLPIEPPLARMTQMDFDRRQKEILASLPEEFHGFVNNQAWERGHSAGFEEVISIMENLAEALEIPVADYCSKIELRYKFK